MSGTSMSSPHVAGPLAYFLRSFPNKESVFVVDVSPAALKQILSQYSTTGSINGLDEETLNRLAYKGGR